MLCFEFSLFLCKAFKTSTTTNHKQRDNWQDTFGLLCRYGHILHIPLNITELCSAFAVYICVQSSPASCRFRGSLEDRGRFLCFRPIFYRHRVPSQLGDTEVRGEGWGTLCTSRPVYQRVTGRQSTGCGRTNSLELKLASCACLWTVEGSRKTWGQREHANSTPVHRPNM